MKTAEEWLGDLGIDGYGSIKPEEIRRIQADALRWAVAVADEHEKSNTATAEKVAARVIAVGIRREANRLEGKA